MCSPSLSGRSWIATVWNMAYKTGDRVRIAWLRLIVREEIEDGFILETDDGMRYLLNRKLVLTRILG